MCFIFGGKAHGRVVRDVAGMSKPDVAGREDQERTLPMKQNPQKLRNWPYEKLRVCGTTTGAMAVTRRPYQRQQETCALQRLREAADLGKWQRARDHEKDGRVSRWAVRNSHSTWTSDGFFRLAPAFWKPECTPQAGNRTPSLGNLISPKERPGG